MQILGFFFAHGISYIDLFLLKEFSKQIFIILFEQDCPEAVVHGWCNGNFELPSIQFQPITRVQTGQNWQK